MKLKSFVALTIAVAGFVAAIMAVETQRKPESRGDKTIYVLPLVEDMHVNPNPLQF